MEATTIVAALIAGFVATLALDLSVVAGRRLGVTRMPDFRLIQGAMLTRDESRARTLGFVTHNLAMGTVVFGLLYAALFTTFASSWLVGLLIGVVHGVVSGIALPAFGPVHPRMEGVAALTGEAVVEARADDLRIAEPGFFGVNYGALTPLGVVGGHALYGLVLALVYSGVVGLA